MYFGLPNFLLNYHYTSLSWNPYFVSSTPFTPLYEGVLISP